MSNPSKPKFVLAGTIIVFVLMLIKVVYLTTNGYQAHSAIWKTLVDFLILVVFVAVNMVIWVLIAYLLSDKE